ncbi:kinase-like domain-containing protein [Tanacetum coccineum]
MSKSHQCFWKLAGSKLGNILDADKSLVHEDDKVDFKGDAKFGQHMKTGKTVSMCHRRPFRGKHRAVVKLPDPKRKTLGEKGINCILVGYDEHSKAYRFYVIEPNDFVSINSIIESRDAIFDENLFTSIPRPKDIIPNVEESQMDDHTDDIPSEIPKPQKAFCGISCGKRHKRVTALRLDSQGLEGSLSPHVRNLSFLRQLDLYDLWLAQNKLDGSVFKEMSLLSKLDTLVIEDNKLTGGIPPFLGNITSMEMVIESYSLQNCTRLVDLGLYHSNLIGVLPISIGNLSDQLSILDVDDNQLFGSLPSSIDNTLSGSIPSEIKDLKMLSLLDLSYNNFSGNITSSVGECISLTTLNLGGNQFHGIIPSSLSSLGGLQGEVPAVGVFASASAFSVLGNNRLCGGLVTLELPKCKETGSKKKRFPFFILFTVIAPALPIVLCCVYLLCTKKRNSQPSQSSGSEQFMKVSYNQLLKASNGFSVANLIGEGGFSSVYKGILDSVDDKSVAIKVLHLQNRGAHKSFLAECKAWQNIRHRNLLKIITSCSSVDFHGNDFKALVYESMPKGSVHDWLHSSRLLGTDLNRNSSTGIKGTIGYAPPEYGLGSEMTSSGDGLVLEDLRLISCRDKSSPDLVASPDMVAWFEDLNSVVHFQFHLRTPKVSSMMASIDEDVEKSSLADQDDVGSGLQRVTRSSRSSRSSDHRQPSPRQGRDNRDYDIKRSRYESSRRTPGIAHLQIRGYLESSRRTPGIAHLQIGGYLVETMSDDNFVLEKGFSFFWVKDFPGK